MFRRIDGHSCELPEAVFDLLILREPTENSDVTHISTLDLQNSSRSELPRLVRLALGFDEVRNTVKALHHRGGRALLIPSCYAEPRIDLAQANRIAEGERRRLNSKREVPLRELMDGIEDPIAWIFAAEDPEQAEREPGCHFIYVDSIDGHLQTMDEREAFYNLQFQD